MTPMPTLDLYDEHGLCATVRANARGRVIVRQRRRLRDPWRDLVALMGIVAGRRGDEKLPEGNANG